MLMAFRVQDPFPASMNRLLLASSHDSTSGSMQSWYRVFTYSTA
jgi:hypothetical protein